MTSHALLKKTFWLLPIVVMFFVLATSPAHAASKPITFMPEIPIPGVFDKPTVVTNNLAGQYIRALYIYFMYAVMLVGVVMVVFGGVRWIVAAGSSARISEAKDTIQNAIIGIILALGSYAMLALISPTYINIGIPSINVVAPTYYTGAVAPDLCAINLQIPCGQMTKTGTANIDPTTGKIVTDGSGKQVDKYCMGLACPAGLGTFGPANAFCVLSKDGQTGYWKSNGCTSNPSLPQPPPDPYTGKTTLDASNGTSCGRVGFQTKAGTYCGDEKYNSEANGCYLLGGETLVLDPKDSSKITNAFCPAK